MSKVLIDEQVLIDLANNIRTKTGSQETFKPGQMPTAVVEIPTADLESKSVTINENTTTTITPTVGKDGMSEVTVTTDLPPSDIGDYIRNAASGNPGATVSSGNWVYLIKKIPAPISITKNLVSGYYQGYPGEVAPKLVFTGAGKPNSFSNLFKSCTYLLSFDISDLDSSGIISTSGMFEGCQKITKIDLSGVSTGNVTNMSNMFTSCYALTDLDVSSFNTSNVTNMESMFNSDYAMSEFNLANFNTSKVYSMTYMFRYCREVTKILISSFDMGAVTSIRDMLQGCSKLTNLSFGYDLGKAYATTQSANYTYYTIDVSASDLLTHDSLMSVINGLYDIATKGVQPQKLIIGSTNLAKLTAEEIAIATGKGWTVS